MEKSSQEKVMRRAIELARMAQGRTCPNPMVGAVVCNTIGEIVAEGFHERAGQPHAEVVALNSAISSGLDLSSLQLFVTLEPCNHFGRTPPCTELIFQSGIKSVVVGALDPNPLMMGKSVEHLRSHGMNVQVGVLQKETTELVRGFKTNLEKHRPFITLKCAASLDGKIAASNGESKWITGPEARLRVHEERAKSDSILIGIETILADDPELTARVGDVTHALVKVILDSNLRTPLSAKVLKSKGQTVIYCKPGADSEKKIFLEKMGVKVKEVAATASGRLDLSVVVSDLSQNERVMDLLVEGGGKVLGSFLNAGLFDRVLYFVAPKIIGSTGADAFSGFSAETMTDVLDFKHMTSTQLGPDLLFEGLRP